MISRRLLRIKVFHILYSYLKSGEDNSIKYEKELDFSINKSHDLYFMFFVLLLDVKNYALSRIELAKNRKIPTKEDLNPNMRFVNNAVIKQIETSEPLVKHVENKKLNWTKYPELIKNVYKNLIKSDDYTEYMNEDNHSYKHDKEFVIHFFKNLVSLDLLYQTIEEQSIYWNDDIEFVLSMNIKTIQRLKQTKSSISLLNLYKNEEDREFVKKLFKKAVTNHNENSEIIQANIKNWDVERIAQADLIIMEMAITEIVSFPSIPVKVSLNEYIELSKFYSTEKSSTFINGVLDKIVNLLDTENKITKIGRGLQQ